MLIDGLCVRSVEAPIEVTGDGRTVVGLLAPYNELALVDDGFGPYYERFIPGCFDRCMRGNASYLRVQLEHNGHWVGRGEDWDDGPVGLKASMRLDATEAGREAAFKIADGQTPGLSLSFHPGAKDRHWRQEPKRRDGLRVINREKVKAIHHVALCQVPAYTSAQVMAVRHASVERRADRLAYWQQWTADARRD